MRIQIRIQNTIVRVKVFYVKEDPKNLSGRTTESVACAATTVAFFLKLKDDIWDSFMFNECCFLGPGHQDRLFRP
jgi:hypothetical protein